MFGIPKCYDALLVDISTFLYFIRYHGNRFQGFFRKILGYLWPTATWRVSQKHLLGVMHPTLCFIFKLILVFVLLLIFQKATEGNSSKAHYEVDWTLSPSALIIGGETTGPSNEARRLIQQQGGQPIRIPMVENVDSLSAGVAASVIIYEAYRQTQAREYK